MSGWGAPKNRSYSQNNSRHNQGNYQKRNPKKDNPLPMPELAQNLNRIEEYGTIPDKAFDSQAINKYLDIANFSNTQLRKWYDGLLKITDTLKKILQTHDINTSNLIQVELNIFKLMAQISYDINRNAKRTAKIQEKLLHTISFLQKLIKDYRLANAPEKGSKAQKLQEYLSKLETFWMSLVAYQKGKN